MAVDNLVDIGAEADTVHCIKETECTYFVDSEMLTTRISFSCKFQKS